MKIKEKILLFNLSLNVLFEFRLTFEISKDYQSAQKESEAGNIKYYYCPKCCKRDPTLKTKYRKKKDKKLDKGNYVKFI